MRPSRAAPRLVLAVLLAMAAVACGLIDVFQSSGVEAVTLVYQGNAFVRVDSTVAFTVVVQVGGATLSRPHLSITSSDTSIVALTPGRDSLIGRNTGNATDRKSTRLNSSHGYISYAVFCLKKKKNNKQNKQRHNISNSDDQISNKTQSRV